MGLAIALGTSEPLSVITFSSRQPALARSEATRSTRAL
jgi:hypothetical protein